MRDVKYIKETNEVFLTSYCIYIQFYFFDKDICIEEQTSIYFFFWNLTGLCVNFLACLECLNDVTE